MVILMGLYAAKKHEPVPAWSRHWILDRSILDRSMLYNLTSWYPANPSNNQRLGSRRLTSPGLLSEPSGSPKNLIGRHKLPLTAFNHPFTCKVYRDTPNRAETDVRKVDREHGHVRITFQKGPSTLSACL